MIKKSFKALENLAIKNNLTIVNSINYEEKTTPFIQEETILRLISEISKHFSGRCILYGGHLASPYIYGNRQVRNLSSDIDVYIGMLSLKDLEKKLFFKDKLLSFDKQNNVLFTEFEGVFITFSYYMVGDFIIPYDFLSSKRKIKISKKNVWVCSPEFLVLMKLRRSYSYKKVFGKDVVDIGNILVSWRLGKINFDLYFLNKICLNYFYSDKQLLSLLYSFLNFKENSFNNDERKLVFEGFKDIINSFEEVSKC